MRGYIRPTMILGCAFLAVLLTANPAWQIAQPASQAAVQPAQAAAAAPLAGATRLPHPTGVAPRQPSATPLPSTATVSGDIGRSIDRYLNDLVRAGLFQGTVLVAHNGKLLVNQAYGLADTAGHRPNTLRTRFQIASITKQFTATAIMILHERGLLGLDDPICGYLKDCPPAWRPITIRQLLTHTSGLPNYTDLASFDATQMLPAQPGELVARFRDLPLLFPPGSSYFYENSDYVLLGLVIERVTGMRYTEALSKLIFAPLGMADTGAGGSGPAAAEWAIGYRVRGEKAPALDPSTLFAAGELYSTSEDLYRWDQALYGEQLLPQRTLATMWQPGAGSYGYGWKITVAAGGHRKISHPGLMDGFANSIARYPDDHVTVILLCNMSAADVEGISDYIANLVFDS